MLYKINFKRIYFFLNFRYNKNGDIMKKFIWICLLIAIIGLIVNYKNQITEYILLNYVYKNDFNYTNNNEYKKNTDYSYFKSTDNYKPNNKQDILNIMYTSINNGYDKFNFYCQNEYSTCIEDVKDLTNNYELLSNIDNFVHPFNSYDQLNVNINGLGKISISVEKLYTEEMIDILNTKVDEIYNNIISDTMTNYEKVKTIHDYIIDNTKYDQAKADDLINNTKTSTHLSNTAYGPLIEGYGICSGYTDAMALFLNKMDIPNYKISSSNHVWNFVYLDDTWVHIDLTWDDPVIKSGEEVIDHDYFAITTEELLNKETAQHNFDQTIFVEAMNK